jgi:hypothetical protein
MAAYAADWREFRDRSLRSLTRVIGSAEASAVSFVFASAMHTRMPLPLDQSLAHWFIGSVP